MSSINSFYNSILNIDNSDKKEIIKGVVKQEKEKLLNKVDDLSGFCKYIASKIEYKLTKERIRSYYIDLNDILGVDHVVLIAEYMFNNELNRLLIDPTYIQFVKKDKANLIRLKKWPSEKIGNCIIVNDLINSGVTKVDSVIFSDYLSSFSEENINLDLEKYLLDVSLNGISKSRH
jgi:hypothetical protein